MNSEYFSDPSLFFPISTDYFPNPTPKEKTIVILGGYAQAGKSETVKIFRKASIPVFSSSELLHSTYQKIFERYNGYKINSKNKDNFVEAHIDGSKLPLSIPIRQDLIHLAENILVENFTRSVFAIAMIEKIVASEEELFVIEAYGNVEYEKLTYLISKLIFNARIYNINIRRSTEDPTADGRTLLPEAVEIQNNSTIENLEKSLQTFLWSIMK
jgi:hypothetical protein